MIPFNNKIKEKAVVLRKDGKSYSKIAKKLGIGKSTVGFWLKNIADSKKSKKLKKGKKKLKK